MTQKTPLYDQHVALGAQIVDFSGWDMPLHYGSQIEEHHAVRQAAGIFDVSHMGVLDVSGSDALSFLRNLLANDVAKLQVPGKALYTCMLNEQGGVVDDLIVYFMSEGQYRLVLNAGCFEADMKWIKTAAASFAVTLDERNDLGMIALQGPKVFEILKPIFPERVSAVEALKPFYFTMGDGICIARTGYTGEDGVEIIADSKTLISLWERAIALGVQPCGLGARDTLRLEAGLNLYGHDMTETTSPLISNLTWTVDFNDDERDFIGKQALTIEKNRGVAEKLVGLVMEQSGVLRDHQSIFIGEEQVGEITSGSFSPTLGHAIALARVIKAVDGDAEVERRGKRVAVKLVKPPFVRHGEKRI